MIKLIELNLKVLILAQRGDWPGCEQAIKGLEKVSNMITSRNDVND